MSFTEDVLIRIVGEDQASSVFSKVQTNAGKLKVIAGAAMTAEGAATLSYAKDAVNSAITAESEWARFGSAVDQTGGNWDNQSTEIKKWISNYSNSMGYAVADTRSAMTAMMNYGLSCSEAEKSMDAVTGMAAKLGITQEQAASQLTKAFAGQGRGLKQLGLNISDYKDATTGAIDKQKLLQDILNKTGNAAEKHASTQEAQVTRVNNALKSIKTDFGYALLSAIEPLLPIIQQFLQGINSLPGPVKTLGFAFVGLTAGAAAISGPLMSLQGLLQTLGVSFSDIAEKIGLAKTKLGELGNTTTSTTTSTSTDAGQILGGGIGQADASNEYDKYKSDRIDTGGTGPGTTVTAGNDYQDIISQMEKEEEGLDDVKQQSDKLSKKTKQTEDSVKKTGKSGKGLKTGLEETTDIIPKGVGSKATTAGVEAETASAGFSGLSAGITSMLVPILTLAAVVAVIIAVVAVLVVEALLFARAIAEVIQALGFDKIDLSASIEGIKSIGTALWELANALAAMTITSVVGLISQYISLITGGLKSIANAANSLKAAVPVVNSMASMPDIDQGAVTKLKALGEGLKGLSQAASSLTSSGTDIWLGGFTNFITGGSLNNIKNAHDDLVKAVPIINSYSDLPQVDTTASQRLKDVGDAMKNVSTAMKSLGSVGIDVVWNSGSLNIASLASAHSQLKAAAQQINKFSDIPAITPVGGKLVPLINALKPIKSAIESLNTLQGLTIPPASIATKVQQAKQRIRGVAVQINDMQSIPSITSVGGKLNSIGSGITSIINSVKSLNRITSLSVPPASIATKVQQAKQRLRGVAVQLNDMKSLPNVGNIGGKLNRITTAMTPLRSAINSIRNVPNSPANIVARVKKGVTAIKNVAKELNGLKGTNVGNVSGILNSVKTAMKQLNSALSATKVQVRATSVGIGQSITSGVRSGLSGLRSAVVGPTQSAMSAMTPIAVSGARTAGTQGTNGFKYTFKLADIAKQEMNYAVQAVKSGGSALASACRQVAEDAVAAAKEGAESHSPGAIARMWGQEIGVYSVQKVNEGKSAFIRAIRQTAVEAVKAWGNPTLTTKFNTAGLNNLANTMNKIDLKKPGTLNTIHDLSNSRPTESLTKSNVTQLHIHEGAVQLDARNLTDKECKQIMITGLESLDCVRNIEIKGMK